MPDLVSHAVVAPIVGGTVSTVIGAVFGITPDVLLAAFIGAWMGAALNESTSFKQTILAIIIGTVAVGYLIPIVFSLWPTFSMVSLSFIVGFIVVYFHALVLTQVTDAIKRLFSKIGA